MIKVGWNYGSKTQCPLCFVADDTQEHVLLCSKLWSDRMTVDSDLDINNLEKHIKIYETGIRKRETALDECAKKDNRLC